MHHKEEGTDGETDRETLGEIDIVPDEEHVTTGQAPPRPQPMRKELHRPSRQGLS